MKLLLSCLFLLPLGCSAFVPAAFLPKKLPHLMAAPSAQEDIDFDAPTDRLKAAGHLVASGDPKLLDHEIVVDDDDALDDYDPLHGNGVVSGGHSDDRTDFDAPMYRSKAVGNVVRSGEGGELDHEPVVDDECYMGKDGSFGECVDFDPPKAS